MIMKKVKDLTEEEQAKLCKINKNNCNVCPLCFEPEGGFRGPRCIREIVDVLNREAEVQEELE